VRSRSHIRYGGWPRVWCAKGIGGEGKAHLWAGTELNKDNNGKPIVPPIRPQNMGVDGLKDDLLGNDDGFGFLAVEDDSPGQIYFPINFSRRHYDEIFAEHKVDGKYDRGGRPNETLDLLVGTEACRLLINPDKQGRNWTPGFEPIWAKPVSLTATQEGGDQTAGVKAPPAAPSKSIFERFDALNEG
jgi:phage terminase large subunit GpA-like protein